MYAESHPAGPAEAELILIDQYWRAANYLSVGQIYLLANPLLRLPLAGTVALVHSPRAGARLAALLPDRADVRLAAISAAAAEAAGDGWAAVAVAPTPDDAALVATGLSLAGAGSYD